MEKKSCATAGRSDIIDNMKNTTGTPRRRPTLADFPADTLTVEEAGGVFGMGRASAYKAASCGQIPTIRIGRRLLVPKYALATLLGIPNYPTTHEGPAANGTLVETSTIAHTESDHAMPRQY